MKRFLICAASFVAASLIVLPVVATLALAHSEGYRGPAGQVPPTNRTPTEPPATGDGGGSTGGGGGGGGGTTGGGGPFAGGGATVGPRVGPGGTTPGAGTRVGATTPGRHRKAAKTEGFERWEFWWAHNREPFLNLREHLAERGLVSGSADWLLGSHKKEDALMSQRPGAKSIRDRVIPALRRALADEFAPTRASAVIAIAKTGDASVYPDIVNMLADRRTLVSESAALALGILGDTSAIPLLGDVLLDTSEGRRAVQSVQGVPFRTRAFAATGLGLIGDARGVPALLAIADPSEKFAHRDLPVCAIVALGVLGEPARDALPTLVRLMTDMRADELVRAHAVVAASKIGTIDDIPLPLLLRLFYRDSSKHVERSAALALGRVARPEHTQAVRQLAAKVRKGSDAQTRYWSCIALGRIGGPEAEKALRTVVADSTGSLRAYGALGLAILGRDGACTEAAPTIRALIREEKDPSIKGALAIALGILADRESEGMLAKIVAGRNAPSLRGYAAVALGLMDARSSMPVIEPLLHDRSSDPDLQRAAATALGLMADRRVVRTLSDTVRNAKTAYVRGSASQALGLIGDYSAIDPLATSLLDKATPAFARDQAAVALGAIVENRPLPIMHLLAVDSNYRAMVESLNLLFSII